MFHNIRDDEDNDSDDSKYVSICHLKAMAHGERWAPGGAKTFWRPFRSAAGEGATAPPAALCELLFKGQRRENYLRRIWQNTVGLPKKSLNECFRRVISIRKEELLYFANDFGPVLPTSCSSAIALTAVRLFAMFIIHYGCVVR